MKKVLFVLAIVFLFAATAQAQVGFGVKGGMTIAKLTGDNNDDLDSRSGFTFGAYAEMPIGESMSFQPGFTYVQKGAEWTEYFGEDSVDVTLKLDYFEIPLLFKYTVAGEGALGLGKPLKSITHPLRSEVPIFLASLGHKNVALTAEIADGWLPTFWSPSQAAAIWGDDLGAGFERSGDPGARDRFRIVPMVPTVIDDDLDAARNAAKPGLALTGERKLLGRRRPAFASRWAHRFGVASLLEAFQRR